MKDILEAINTKLIADSTLKTLLAYDESTHNIRSFTSLKKYTFDTLLLFGKLAGHPLLKKTPKIRGYTLQIQALDRIDSNKVDDILERVIIVLNDIKLEVSDSIRSLSCEWANTLPIFYDADLKFYVGVSNYSLIITDIS